jgi:hypothetical protein
MAIRDVGLARDEEVPGGVLVHMSLVTYFSAEENQTPRAPRAALAKRTAR